jgi:hypothetical protein
MSFYTQPLTYQCGPFALKYALVMLGKMEDEAEIERLAGSTWWYGTDEIGLARAAEHYDCGLVEINESSSDKAITKLDKHLNKGYPAILCVDKWSHWIAVIAKEGNKYICVDSGMKKVIIVLPKKELLRRWKYSIDDIEFSGYKLVPWFTPKTTACFSIQDAKKLMTKKYENLALHWDSYFSVLSEIGKVSHTGLENVMSFREFLRRNQKSMVELIADWHTKIEYQELNNIFENFLFIANIYDMVIHNNSEKSAIINFTTVLTLYAALKYETSSYL